MSKLTVTAKGQITLKKDILEHLGVATGAQVLVEKLPDGRIEVRAAPAGEITAAFGLLKRKGGRRLSIEQINEVARQGWSGRIAKKK
ncbi:MAG: AbrB/MazE/SpoVT family DNA-binding domain-containing protein [Hyphomonadaceae bacterium]